MKVTMRNDRRKKIGLRKSKKVDKIAGKIRDCSKQMLFMKRYCRSFINKIDSDLEKQITGFQNKL